MSLSDAERAVRDLIEQRTGDLVALASELIAFDTTARNVGDPPRQEAALQELLAERLRAIGAEIDVWEPDPALLHGKPLVPPGLDFAGRPQLVARKRGAGGGRALLLNGHVDVVSAEPRGLWTSDPFVAEVRDGRLYGRGACDMKGGIAAMVVAAETLASLGIDLDGDLVVATNTDEESSGAGGRAIVERGVHADAGIVTEPTGLDVWVACRGSEYGVVRVPGRPGHAEVRQPDWRTGGAVNAIEKATVVIDAIRSLRADWVGRQGLEHPYLSRPDLLPTMAAAGEWPVTYPSACDLTLAVMYLPAQADADGWGSAVRHEVEDWIHREAARDEWLAANPPTLAWWPNGVMPLEIPETEPIVGTMVEAARDVGASGRLAGLDSWYDGATFTFAGIPSIGFGPAGLDNEGMSLAHVVDECVPVEGLVVCAQAVAVAAMRFCRSS
jgi:acetylornithine deacetylase